MWAMSGAENGILELILAGLFLSTICVGGALISVMFFYKISEERGWGAVFCAVGGFIFLVLTLTIAYVIGGGAY